MQTHGVTEILIESLDSAWYLTVRLEYALYFQILPDIA